MYEQTSSYTGVYNLLYVRAHVKFKGGTDFLARIFLKDEGVATGGVANAGAVTACAIHTIVFMCVCLESKPTRHV